MTAPRCKTCWVCWQRQENGVDRHHRRGAARPAQADEMLDVLDLPHVNRLLVLNASCHGDTLDDVLTSFQDRGLAQQAICPRWTKP